ncbi:hypothetical protein MTR67_008569 [Solanum verrucosum]|uniref:Integrase catalytic domain-containing protein n=1 Tax=Solanum verrucosum TaxID=315347 RepID=A0AAF0Q895_SOLVR|nr:hypothetical protein MTR67_008566 [Solanum verrucosum]WMV15184.1 hypothetical protein MTR67_008569 [Solanum verrucosum]
MSFFLTLEIIDTKSDPTVNLIKKELVGATTIKRETLIVFGDADDIAIDVDVNVGIDIGDVGAKKWCAERLARIYIREVVHLHGVPASIISDRGSQFTSSFWMTFQEELGTRVHLSTTFYPQTNCQSERIIQILENMLRACVMDFGVGDRVFLRVSPMKGAMRFERRGKLSPRYIGPFEILRAVGEVAYELALPPALSAIHPVFHVSMMRRYVPDESHVSIAILVRDVRQLRLRAFPVVKVRWRHHPVEEATWETEQEMREQFPSLFETLVFFFPKLIYLVKDALMELVSMVDV